MTTEQKHTDGPWEEDGLRIIGPKESDGVPALICTLNRRLPENGKLIAAAPELLQALECLLIADVSRYQAAVEIAQKAIAKATKGTL